MTKNLGFTSLLFGIVTQQASCFCPPLLAPTTTEMKCLEPIKHQLVDCSTSWLPEGTVSLFACRKGLRARATGKIVCSETGIHRHVKDTGVQEDDDTSLPCGIYRDLEKPEIQIYGFQSAMHYIMENQSTSDFRIVGEMLHNEFRTLHNALPLRLNATLSSLAQRWATEVSNRGRLDMASDLPYGQNVFLADTGNNLTSAVNDAVKNWYYNGVAEYCWEDITDNWTNSLSLAFSQIVWRNSTGLGIGAAPMKWGNRTAVIAFYDPTGNIVIDEDEETSSQLFKDNVMPKRLGL